MEGDGLTGRLLEDISKEKYDIAIELSGQQAAGKVLIQCNSRRKFISNLYGCYGELITQITELAVLASKSPWDNRHAVERDWLVVSNALSTDLPPPRLEFKVEAECIPIFHPALESPFAVFQPASSDRERMWSPERWRKLGVELIERQVVKEIVIPYGKDPKEKEAAAAIANGLTGCRLAAKVLTFREHAALLRRCRICITVNTGVMHLAAACGCDIVAIWGRSRDNVWAPFCERFRLVSEDRVLCPQEILKFTTKEHENRPTLLNEVETVLSAASQMLNG